MVRALKGRISASESLETDALACGNAVSGRGCDDGIGTGGDSHDGSAQLVAAARRPKKTRSEMRAGIACSRLSSLRCVLTSKGSSAVPVPARPSVRIASHTSASTPRATGSSTAVVVQRKLVPSNPSTWPGSGGTLASTAGVIAPVANFAVLTAPSASAAPVTAPVASCAAPMDPTGTCCATCAWNAYATEARR